jgi:translation initiation factor 2 beta subunit (eIF-2beta)/eIF-5
MKKSIERDEEFHAEILKKFNEYQHNRLDKEVQLSLKKMKTRDQIFNKIKEQNVIFNRAKKQPGKATDDRLVNLKMVETTLNYHIAQGVNMIENEGNKVRSMYI